MKRRIAVVVAAFSLCFSMVSAAALCLVTTPSMAFADEHKHPVCGKSHVDMRGHSGACADLVWTAVTDAGSMPSTSGNYYLGNDITLSTTWTVPEGATVSLCLNGKTLSGNNAVQVIHVPEGATLSICDCSTGKLGKITGGNALESAPVHYKAGGGIGVVRGSLELFGGSICGNRAQSFQSGGVNLVAASFRMYGGSISSNTAAGAGGGVGLFSAADGSSEFILYGGTVSNNEAGSGSFGGGVYVNSSSFEMHGGEIKGNVADYGGGIRLDGGSLRLCGGEVSGNRAEAQGGGLWLSSLSKVVLSGSGSVAGNHVGSSSSNAAGDIHFNANSANGDSAVLGLAGPLSAGSGGSGPMYVSAAFGAGVVAQGVDGDGDGTPYAITSADAGRFAPSPLHPVDGLSLFLDEPSNQIMLGRQLDAATTSFTLSETSFAYNGESQKPTLVVMSGSQTLVEGADEDYVVEWPSDTVNAGAKTVVVKGSLSAPDCYAGSKALTFTINPKAVTPVIAGVEDEYTYTGSAIRPAVTVTDGETVLTEGDDYDVFYGANTDVVGGGSVKVTLKGNYVGSAEKTFAITKALPTCIAPVAAGFTYDGDYHYLVLGGDAIDAGGDPMDILYSLSEGGSYGVSIPQARNADSYTVWWKIEGDANHVGIGPFSVDVTVLPAELRPIGLKAKDRDFDGTRQVKVEELMTAGIFGADSVQVDLSSLEGTLESANVGTYDEVTLGQVKLVGADAGNYFVPAGLRVPANPAVVIGQSEGSSETEIGLAVDPDGRPGGFSGGSPSGSSGGETSFEVDLYEQLTGVVGYLPDQDDGLTFEINPAYDGDVFEDVSIEGEKLVFSLKEGLPAGSYSDVVTIKVTDMTNYSDLSLNVTIRAEVAAPPASDAIAATGDRALQHAAMSAAVMVIAGLAVLVSCRRRVV